MSRSTARSRCECQAVLVAELDDAHHVLRGFAMRGGARQVAPAHSIPGPDPERFDLGWLCPFCNRNTLRSFYAGALSKAS